MRKLPLGATVRRLDLGAPVKVLPTDRERGNAARAAVYASPRWRRERKAFLRVYPICAAAGCGQRAVVVDHVDGHQRTDWCERFWDQTTWQPLCRECHNRKSARELNAWLQT